MSRNRFAVQLATAMARTTEAFSEEPRPARRGFARQLIDAMVRTTPAFQEAPFPGTTQPAVEHPQQPVTVDARREGSEQFPDLLTLAQVAAVMQISRMSAYRLVHSGHLPAVRVGRSFRVPARAVGEYLYDAHHSMM